MTPENPHNLGPEADQPIDMGELAEASEPKLQRLSEIESTPRKIRERMSSDEQQRIGKEANSIYSWFKQQLGNNLYEIGQRGEAIYEFLTKVAKDQKLADLFQRIKDARAEEITKEQEQKYEDNIRQSRDKSCVLASLANLERFLFDYRSNNSEADLIAKAKDIWTFDESKGMSSKSAVDLFNKLGLTAFIRDSLDDIWTELKNGKGAVVFDNGHATAIYKDGDTIVRRNPLGDKPEMIVADKENLAKWLSHPSGSRPKSAQQLTHVVIVGRLGTSPLTGAVEQKKITADLRGDTRAAIETNLEENKILTFKERISRIFSEYRPRFAFEGATDLSPREIEDWQNSWEKIKNFLFQQYQPAKEFEDAAELERRWSKDVVISPAFNPLLWPRALGRMLTNRSFWLAGPEWHGRIDWQKTDREVSSFVQYLGNKRLEEAYQWEVADLQQRVNKGEFANEREAANWLEGRMISEQIVFAEQDQLIRKGETEYLEQLEEHIGKLEQRGERGLDQSKAERRAVKSRLAYLKRIRKILQDKPLAEAHVDINELRVGLYANRPDIFEQDIDSEYDLVKASRRTWMDRQLDKWDADVRKNKLPVDHPAIKALEELYQLSRTGKVIVDRLRQLRSSLLKSEESDLALIRKFVSLQDEQSRWYYEMVLKLSSTESVWENINNLTEEPSVTGLEDWIQDNKRIDVENTNDLIRLAEAYEGLRPDLRPNMLNTLRTNSLFADVISGVHAWQKGETISDYVARRLREIAENEARPATAPAVPVTPEAAISIEVKVNDIDFRAFAEKLTLEPQASYEESLDGAIQALQGIDGILEQKHQSMPTIVVADIHARRDFIVNILNQTNRDGKPVMEMLRAGEINLVFLGDGMHSEDKYYWMKDRVIHKLTELREAAQDNNGLCAEIDRIMDQMKNLSGKEYGKLNPREINKLQWDYPQLKSSVDTLQKILQPEDFLKMEMVRSLGAMKMTMELMAEFPEYVQYVRGNHDDIGERLARYYKYAHESQDVKNWIINQFGQPFLDKYITFEDSLPLVVKGQGFIASHAAPGQILTQDQIINRRPRVTQILTWTDNRVGKIDQAILEDNINQTMHNIGADGLTWIIGHRPIDTGKYRSQFNNKLIQINDTEMQLFAVFYPDRPFNPDTDTYNALETTTIA